MTVEMKPAAPASAASSNTAPAAQSLTLTQVQQGLRELALKHWDVTAQQLDDDISLNDMNVDSLMRLEFLMSADEQFGSGVLDKVEDGVIPQPHRLSELAALIVNDLGLVKN